MHRSNYPYWVARRTPLNDVGLFTWLTGRLYHWHPDAAKRPIAHFYFKEIDDALLFKLMWC